MFCRCGRRWGACGLHPKLIGWHPGSSAKPFESGNLMFTKVTAIVSINRNCTSPWLRKVRYFSPILFERFRNSCACEQPYVPYPTAAPTKNLNPRTCANNTLTAKSRTIMVRLISMAMTGYYRTMQRPRAHQPLSMLKYDPIGTPPITIVLCRIQHTRCTQSCAPCDRRYA